MADSKYSTRFSSGKPVNGRINRPIGGGCSSDTGAITDLETGLLDFNGFVAVPAGAKICLVVVDFADADAHATPTATAQLILRRVVAGVVTDTVLVDLDTGVQSALKTFYVLDQAVVDDDNGYGIVGVVFDAAAATAGTGANKLTAFWF